MQHLTCLLQNVRSVEYVLQDLKDTLILVIFKGKSSKYDYKKLLQNLSTFCHREGIMQDI